MAALDKAEPAEQFAGMVQHSSQLSALWFQAPYTAGRKAVPHHLPLNETTENTLHVNMKSKQTLKASKCMSL